MNSNEIRAAFLRFFESKGHTVLPSSPLIPDGDPTLLLTTAGMVQMKPYFLGLSTPPNPRLASCQKCFRTTDIDEVGDTKHLTFFEMLGNFSVGEYFKKEAIEWAWEFVAGSEWLGLSPEHMWITIFLDDDEAFNYWREIGVPAERIMRLGEKDNFWGPAGDSGPCGPCSEIHYDFGEEYGCGSPDCGPSCECARFSEIWNLVFTQYNQDKEGKRTPLPKPNIDTGMGLERITAVMQGKVSVYETDLFSPIVARVEELTEKRYGQTNKDTDRAIRIVAEHARGISFLIADRVIPGNEGRGYVLRRLLRRTTLFGRKLGLDRPFLKELAAVVIDKMGGSYSELAANRDFILGVIDSEEKRFEQTLDTGLNWLDKIMENLKDKSIPGNSVFMLYDTFGFPAEITAEIAAERGFSVDLEGFEEEMKGQRQRARAAHRFGNDDRADLQLYDQMGISPTDFVGYDRQSHGSSVVGLIIGGKPADTASEGDEVGIILKETPFYGEMGGQVGDSGEIRGTAGKADVSQALRPLPDIVVHQAKVTKGKISAKDRVEAEIDIARREDIARNHTATHLLHSALRAVLGEQVRQSGSLVAPERLRFDFTHLGSVSKGQLAEIQQMVNDFIRQNLPVKTNVMSYTEAMSRNAIALFGEKYGDTVRLLEVGDPPVSVELCGGTHVKSTGEIGFFLITAESSIGSGLRRIEAVTGREAELSISRQLSTLESLAKEMEISTDELPSKLSATLAELDRERKRAASLELELAGKEAESLLSQVETVGDIKVVSARLSTTSPEAMRAVGDRLKEEIGSGVIVLGSIYNNRPNFVAMVTPDLADRNLHAGEIVKQVAKVAGGGGGGKAELGQGSGKDSSKLEEALNSVARFIPVMEPENEDSLISRGESLSDSDRYEEALVCFNKAIDMNPQNIDSLLNKGWLLGKLGDHEEALACYNKALDIKPNDELAWYNKGNRLSDLGKHEEALECYNRVLDLTPTDALAWCNKGNRLKDLERYEEAAACFNQAIQFNFTDAEAWYNKAICLEILGQKEEAESCLKQARELGFPEA